MYTGWQQKRRVKVRVRKKNKALASISIFCPTLLIGLLTQLYIIFKLYFHQLQRILTCLDKGLDFLTSLHL